MRSTRYTELVGCEVPVQLAPMGSVSTIELAAAVTSAGGHAMLGLAGLPLPAVEQLCAAAESRGVGPFGVNFLVPFLDREVLQFVAARVPLVDFYLGPPDRALIDTAHAGGALAQWQVRSLAEAIAAEEAGCDAIVAHGVEAGGRNPGGIGLIPLLEQVLDSVRVPVVAAGGIATGRGVAAALAMGADAVRLGTRFAAAPESAAHPEYRAAIVAASAEDAVHTDAFDLMFPPGLGGSRALRSAVEQARAGAGEFVGEMTAGPERVPVARFAPFPPLATTTGNIAAMALYAGQSAGAVHAIRPAAEIVAELVRDAEALLEGAARARV